MGKRSKAKRRHALHEQHAGGHREMGSGAGKIQHARSAPYLKKEQVTLTDVIQVSSNANLGDDAQIIRMGPNGLQFFSAAGTAKPQSALWTQYAEMYEFYQTDGFSCRWIPNKFEFQTDGSGANQPLTAGPAFSCLDPEADFPQTPSAIMAYNTSKIAQPYQCLRNRVSNYKALSIQKQDKTMLKTGDGVIGSEETYVDPAGFVTYVINPWRGATNPQRYIGWMEFTITYTFSGMKRPGAALSAPQNLTSDTISTCSTQASSQAPKPKVQLSDWEIEELHRQIAAKRGTKE